MTKPSTYVAFLRGINVGGRKPIRMDALKESFEAMGFRNVKTVLASGNVLFETADPARSLSKAIEDNLRASFGHNVAVILRSRDDIQSLVEANPFKRVQVTPNTRLYVTFLSEQPKSTLKMPYESPEKDFKILGVSSGFVCSVVTVTPKRGTIDAMAVLEKQFGHNITTRNWNTLLKILKN